MKKEKKLQRISALKYALENQIGWQRYAEAKNVILFTVSGTTLISLLTVIYDKESYPFFEKNNEILKPVLLVFIFLTLVAFLLTMFSIAINLFSKTKAEREKDKILFINWNFIRRRKQEELVRLLEDYNLDKQVEDLIDQHLIGSKLTYTKYRYFNWGTGFYLVGVLLFIVTTILILIRDKV